MILPKVAVRKAVASMLACPCGGTSQTGCQSPSNRGGSVADCPIRTSQTMGA